MIDNNDIKKYMIGAHINWIKRTCNLIMFDIVSKTDMHFCLHAECFIKFVKDEKTIACTNDIYIRGRNAKKRKFKWDEPQMSLYDDSISDNENMFLNQQIVNVEFFNSDLLMFLENGVIIKIIPDTVLDNEAYRIFTQEDDLLIV